MVNYNLIPFTVTINDPARLEHMALVKEPLQTVYNGKIENLRLHIQDFTCRIQNTGLCQEFTIRTQENPRPEDIPEEEWVQDHPLCWQVENFLENFNGVTFNRLLQEKERMDDTLELLDEAPQLDNDEGAPELASKQHRMWIADMLRNSWTATVASEMNAFEEETQGDGVLLFYVFLREHIGHHCSRSTAYERKVSFRKFSV
jgi:hypothetical protein